MRSWMALAALVLAASGKGDVRVARNHARVLAEPRFWARHVGEVERGDKLAVLQHQGTWFKVQLKSRGTVGFVPESTFVDAAVTDSMLSGFDGSEGPRTATASQAANASRGFSQQANAADVSGAHLQQADAWITRYEGQALETQLAKKMPGFLADGRLPGGAR